MEDGLFAAEMISASPIDQHEPPRPLGLPDDGDGAYAMDRMQGGTVFSGEHDNTTFTHGGDPYDELAYEDEMPTGYFAYERAPARRSGPRAQDHSMRKRAPVYQQPDVENPTGAEWQQDVETSLNFAMSVDVRADFKRGTFANILLIATIALLLISVARGTTSFIAQVFTVDINMEHLHIADVGIIVFGVFIVTTMFVFFYIMDYRKTTFSHKLTVMMPYIVACIFYGGGVIAMWNFTRDHGAYVDRSDIIEIIKFQDAHQWFVTGAVLVIVFCFPAYYAHRFPEAETAQRYLLIPTKDLQ